MKKVIIIGSGFGGLSAAIRLQANGFEVTVLEKNHRVGGHASQFTKKGYTFDMGPSLITAPSIIRDIFQQAGKKMEDYLDLTYLDPFYRIYFHDQSKIDYAADSDFMKKQMAEFNPSDAKNYDRFMAYTKKLYEAVILEKMGSRPMMEWGPLLKFIPRALKLRALDTVYRRVKSFFKDERNRFVFSFHPLFIGGSPFMSPAVYLMIPYLEKEEGVWFSKGGMYALVQALEKVFLEIGGQIRTNTPAQEIKIKNGRAVAVETSGGSLEADIIISNAHFKHTYVDLIAQEHRKKWTDRAVLKKEYSMSSFLLYLGVKKKYPQLLHHTLILSERYRELVKDIFNNKILPDDFSMYLHVPSRTDPDMAPADSESMYVLVPVANLKADVDWESHQEIYADKLIDFLEKDFGLEGLRENIEVKEYYTPKSFEEDRNNYLGSAWGVEPRLTQTANLRPHNRSEDIANVYLVGASTHPGAGVPGVMLSAEATVHQILKDTAK